MKLVFTKTLVNNVYTVELAVTEVEATDTDLFADFGEPTIDTGGEIKTTDEGPVLATLPSTYRKVVTQMPVVVRFADAQYNNNAKAIAEAWVLTVEKRINAKMVELRMKNDDFTGTQESII